MSARRSTWPLTPVARALRRGLVSEPVLVVDFGTSTSSAVVVADGAVRFVREPAGGWSRPSAVCRYGAEILVGTPAENVGRSDPACYREEFKRDLGSTTPILLGDKTFRPEELTAEVLRVLREQGEQLHGSPIAHAVLTIPASYGPADRRRDLMITAAELAGFAEVELLAEPVAAAHAPITGKPFTPGDVVLVYDFGGGTFDTALVRISADAAHQVLGHAALDDCGGRDIDARLIAHARELAGEQLIRLLDAPPDDPAAQLDAQYVRMELGELTRRAKHQLTNVATTRDYFRPSRQQLSLDRTELAALVAPEIARTITCCRDLLARLGLTRDCVTGIVMVGGSSHVPAVVDAVTWELGRPLRHTEDPTLAVINGAAQWALRSPARVEAPWPVADNERPLRWKIPGGVATVIRWLVEPGQQFDADTPLVAVRSIDGSLWRLAADKPGVLTAVHADAGETVVSGAWLATTNSMSHIGKNRRYTAPGHKGAMDA